MAQHLSACGWQWHPDHRLWWKGDQGKDRITDESLKDLLSLHPWAVPHIWQALIDGAVEFNVRVERSDNGLAATITWRKEDEEWHQDEKS